MNFPSHSTQREPTGKPLSLRLAVLSILSPLITTTAFCTMLTSAGVIPVPPTREFFGASALVASADPMRKAAIRFISQEYHELIRCGQFDRPRVRAARNPLLADGDKI